MRFETPSPDRGLSETQGDTPNQGNETLTNIYTDIQGILSGDDLRLQLTEPSQVCNEIQAWTENFEQENNDRIMKMKEEMENKQDTILKKITNQEKCFNSNKPEVRNK